MDVEERFRRTECDIHVEVPHGDSPHMNQRWMQDPVLVSASLCFETESAWPRRYTHQGMTESNRRINSHLLNTKCQERLVACRAEVGPAPSLDGVITNGSLHESIQTWVPSGTLLALAVTVLRASCNILTTQVHAAAGIARAGIATAFERKKGEELPEFCWRTKQMLTVSATDGGDQLDPESTAKLEFKYVLHFLGVLYHFLPRSGHAWRSTATWSSIRLAVITKSPPHDAARETRMPKY